MLIRAVLSAAICLGVLWVALALALLVARPRDLDPRSIVRIVPDTIRLLHRLHADDTLGRGVRWRLRLLVVYLAMPLDLIPDFIPVIGHVDDVVVVLIAVRSVLRHAGEEALRRHWPGSAEGLDVLVRAANALSRTSRRR